MKILVIVLIIFISLTFLIISILTSKVKIEINTLSINSSKELANIVEKIAKKKKRKMLNHINLKVKIKIYILGIVPVFFIRLDSQKVKKIIEKEQIRELREKDKNKLEKKKQKIDEAINEILEILQMKKLNINMSVGVGDACATAVIVTLINILILITMPCIFAEQNINDNCLYDIKPVYSDKVTFNLFLKATMEIPFYKVI